MKLVSGLAAAALLVLLAIPPLKEERASTLFKKKEVPRVLGVEGEEQPEGFPDVARAPEQKGALQPDKTAATLPKRVLLKLPWTPQAPHAVWDFDHDNACEEAAIYMVAEALLGRRPGKVEPDEADAKILEMIAWQREHWGGHRDITIEETATLAKVFYPQLKTRVLQNATLEDLKRELARGNVVILPSAGRLLGNPYFRRPGPIYHMFPIKGYDSGAFITNDNGTRRGEGYRYLEETILRAWHDWPGSAEKIEQGARNALVLEKES